MPAFLANTAYNMLVYVRQCRRSASSAGSADKSAGSVDQSAGSADKSVGTLHLHTLRNALKIN